MLLETDRVDVLAVIEAGLHGPLSRTKKRRPLCTADIMSILYQPGYKILLPATWSHDQQARMFIYYRDTLRIKEKKVPLNLTDLPLLSVEVSKGMERSTLFSCFYRDHMGGVSSIESQKNRLQRVLSWRSTLSTLIASTPMNLTLPNPILSNSTLPI